MINDNKKKKRKCNFFSVAFRRLEEKRIRVFVYLKEKKKEIVLVIDRNF